MKAEAATASASAAAAAVSAVGGHLLGVPLAALIGGFAGGLVAVLLKRPVEDTGPTTGKVVALAGSLIVSVLCAGFAGPFTAAWLNNPAIEDAIELAFFSFLWGAGAQMGLLTTAVAALQRRIDKLGGS